MPTSYPMTTSVVVPPHPLLPPAVNINRHEGSTSTLTGAKNMNVQTDAIVPDWCPGMIQKGGIPCLGSLVKSYNRKLSYDALTLIILNRGIPYEIPSIWHCSDGSDWSRIPRKPKIPRRRIRRFMNWIFLYRSIPSTSINEISIRRPTCLIQ